jgi:hypothetical protein
MRHRSSGIRYFLSFYDLMNKMLNLKPEIVGNVNAHGLLIIYYQHQILNFIFMRYDLSTKRGGPDDRHFVV